MKKGLLLMMSLVLLTMTSCLKEGEQSLSGQADLFYVNQTTEGVKFGYNGNIAITSDEIQKKESDKWYVMSWMWNSKMGMKAQNLYNVSTSNIRELSSGLFHKNEIPANYAHVPMAGFAPKLQTLTPAFGDYVLYEVSYKKKEGEKIELHLFSDLKQGEDASQTRLIDIRLVKSGTGTGEEKTYTDVFAVKMGALRDVVSLGAGEQASKLNVKYRYYLTADKATETNSMITIYKR